ncbi:MAG: hypothetical protein EA378_03730 [Phycisphaerales bacterium]|nr:MAG: hypothetical protein EA378_03730 [Phycisphaerales bacterium]
MPMFATILSSALLGAAAPADLSAVEATEFMSVLWDSKSVSTRQPFGMMECFTSEPTVLFVVDLRSLRPTARFVRHPEANRFSGGAFADQYAVTVNYDKQMQFWSLAELASPEDPDAVGLDALPTLAALTSLDLSAFGPSLQPMLWHDEEDGRLLVTVTQCLAHRDERSEHVIHAIVVDTDRFEVQGSGSMPLGRRVTIFYDEDGATILHSPTWQAWQVPTSDLWQIALGDEPVEPVRIALEDEPDQRVFGVSGFADIVRQSKDGLVHVAGHTFGHLPILGSEMLGFDSWMSDSDPFRMNLLTRFAVTTNHTVAGESPLGNRRVTVFDNRTGEPLLTAEGWVVGLRAYEEAGRTHVLYMLFDYTMHYLRIDADNEIYHVQDWHPERGESGRP